MSVQGRLRQFTVQVPRPLPVLLLVDVSGSMVEDGKLSSLNLALKELIAALAEERSGSAEIQVAVIAVGGHQARLHLPLIPARQARYEVLEATGTTPLGSALTLTTRILEDRTLVPDRAYLPTVVLLSDGSPTDSWEEPLRTLLASPRASQAVRLALAVGADADLEVLHAFAGAANVRQSTEARHLRRFFRYVAMNVTSRSRSASPDRTVALPDLGHDDGFDDLDV